MLLLLLLLEDARLEGVVCGLLDEEGVDCVVGGGGELGRAPLPAEDFGRVDVRSLSDKESLYRQALRRAKNAYFLCVTIGFKLSNQNSSMIDK